MIRQSKVTVARRDNSICEKGGLPLQTHITDRSPRLRHFCLQPSPPSHIIPPVRILFVTATMFMALFDLSH
jgi:hypothetical protein